MPLLLWDFTRCGNKTWQLAFADLLPFSVHQAQLGGFMAVVGGMVDLVNCTLSEGVAVAQVSLGGALAQVRTGGTWRGSSIDKNRGHLQEPWYRMQDDLLSPWLDALLHTVEDD